MLRWEDTPAGKAWRRQYANARYQAKPKKPKQRHARHLCTSCDRPGHNSRTCPEPAYAGDELGEAM